MKKSIFLVLLAISSLVKAQETGVVFLHDTVLSTALAQAEKQGKLLFVDCYTTWCGPCKNLSKNIFPLKEVGDFYNQHFVNAKFDMDQPEGKMMMEKYQIRGFPTLLFLNANGELVHLSIGGGGAEDIIELGKAALDTTKNLISLLKKIKNGDRSEATLTLYLQSNPNEDNKEVLLNEYFNRLDDEGKLSKPAWELLRNYIRDMDHKQFQFLLANRSEFEKSFGKPEVDRFLAGGFGFYMYKNPSANGDYKKLKDIDSIIFKSCLAHNEFGMAMNSFHNSRESRESWLNLIKKAEIYLANESIHPVELNQFSWFVFENYKTFGDTAALKLAKDWSARSCGQMPESDAINDTYGHILFDLGFVEEAIKYEEIALARGKESGSPYLDFYIEEVERFKKSQVK